MCCCVVGVRDSEPRYPIFIGSPVYDSPTTDIPYRNTLLLSLRTSDGLGHSLGQCVFIWYGKNVMVTIPLLLDYVADFCLAP